MQRRVVFRGKLLPYLLLAPQLAVTLLFFFWPAGQAIWQSLHREDPFGLSSRFVGIDNFTAVLADPAYLHSLGVTAVFSVAVTVLAVAPSLLLAVVPDRGLAGPAPYKTVPLGPHAVAPAVARRLLRF